MQVVDSEVRSETQDGRSWLITSHRDPFSGVTTFDAMIDGAGVGVQFKLTDHQLQAAHAEALRDLVDSTIQEQVDHYQDSLHHNARR